MIPGLGLDPQISTAPGVSFDKFTGFQKARIYFLAVSKKRGEGPVILEIDPQESGPRFLWFAALLPGKIVKAIRSVGLHSPANIR